MISYETQKKNLAQITRHFDKMKGNYEVLDLRTPEGEKVPAIFTNYSYWDYTFDMLFLNNMDSNWINLKCMILDTEGLDKDSIFEIYELCLNLNYQLAETTFSVESGHIFVEADMPLDISYSDFKVELQQLSKGIDAFVDKFDKDKLLDTTGKLKFRA
jgi:hypothetical protein